MIEHAKFTYSPLQKTLEKQTKTIEDEGEKQMKVIGDHGKQIIESNEPIKNDINTNRDSIPFEEQQKNTL